MAGILRKLKVLRERRDALDKAIRVLERYLRRQVAERAGKDSLKGGPKERKGRQNADDSHGRD